MFQNLKFVNLFCLITKESADQIEIPFLFMDAHFDKLTKMVKYPVDKNYLVNELGIGALIFFFFFFYT